MFLNKIIKNNVFIYLSSRYMTYFLMFVTSMVAAEKLGPYFLGIWGFILMMLQFFQNFDFGIPNALNVFYVHNKYKDDTKNDYIFNSLFLISVLSLIVFTLILLSRYMRIGLLDKYEIGSYLIWIAIISALQYFYNLIIVLLRVKNRIISTSFVLSFIGIINFIGVFYFSGEKLLYFFIVGYLLGYFSSIVIALLLKVFPPINSWELSRNYQKQVVRKGFFLFLYNLFTNLIFLSIRFLISSFYPVEDFGQFTFSYTIVVSILLLLNSLSFIVFPKIVDRFSGNNVRQVFDAIKHYRLCYIYPTHFLIYSALPAYPLFLSFFPSYDNALLSIQLISLALLIGTHVVGFTEYLIAQDKEQLLSGMILFELVINCTFAMILIKFFSVSFEYVIIATLFSNFIYALTVSFYSQRMCGMCNPLQIVSVTFPYRLMIPFCIALISCLVGNYIMLFVPIVTFLWLNKNNMKPLFLTIKELVNNPSIINLK